MTTHVSTGARRFGFLVAPIATLTDQITKAWALSGLWPPYSEGIALLPVLNLRLGFNSGGTFGMFAESAAGAVWLLITIKVVIVAFPLRWRSLANGSPRTWPHHRRRARQYPGPGTDRRGRRFPRPALWPCGVSRRLRHVGPGNGRFRCRGAHQGFRGCHLRLGRARVCRRRPHCSPTSPTKEALSEAALLSRLAPILDGAEAAVDAYPGPGINLLRMLVGHVAMGNRTIAAELN